MKVAVFLTLDIIRPSIILADQLLEPSKGVIGTKQCVYLQCGKNVPVMLSEELRALLNNTTVCGNQLPPQLSMTSKAPEGPRANFTTEDGGL